MGRVRPGRRAKEERRRRAQARPRVQVWEPHRWERRDPIRPGVLVMWADYIEGEVVLK